MVNVIEIRVRATDETKAVYDKVRADSALEGRDSGSAFTSAFASQVRGAGGQDIAQSLATSIAGGTGSVHTDAGKVIGDEITDSISDTIGKELPTKVEDPIRKSAKDSGSVFASTFQGDLGQSLSSSALGGLGRSQGEKFTVSFGQGAKDAMASANLGGIIGDALGTGIEDAVPDDVLGPSSPAGQKIRENAKKTGEQAGKDAGEGMSPLMTTAIVGGLSVGAPAILGAFGAITGGIAAMALRNNAVIKQDFTDLGHVADQAVTQAAAPLAGTLHQALVSVEGTVKTLQPELKTAFSNAGPDITAMASGVESLATNALPGLSSALKDSQVIVSDLGKGLGGLGSGVGGMFEGLTRDAYTTGAGMESLLDTTGHLASTLGTVLGSAASAGSTALMGLDDALNPTLSLVQRIANPATVGAVAGLFAGMKLDPSISAGLSKAADGVSTLALKSMEAGGTVGKMGGALAGTSSALEKGASIMSGPWGLAIDAGVGLVTGLVGSLMNASHASDALTLSQQGLADAVAKDGGAAGSATAAYIAAQAQADGMAKSAAGAGVSLDTWTEAVLGNGAAQQEVTAAVEKLNQQQRNQAVITAENTASTGKYSDAQRAIAVNAAKAAAANNDLTDANAKTLNSMKAQTAETAAAIAQQQAYQDALNHITDSEVGFRGALAAGHAAMVANAQQSALNTVSSLNLGASTLTLGGMLYNSVSAFNQAAAGAQGYSTVLTALNGTTATLDGAQVTLAQDMLNAKTSFAQNKYSLDLNTQAGINNRQSLDQAATAITNLGTAQYQATGNIDTANKTIQQNIDKFVDATGATGKAKTAIEQYLEQLAKIPASVTTNINQVYTTSGGQVRDTGSGARGAMASGGAYGGAAATGGVRSNLVKVGERGTELVRMPFGSTVIPHSNLESMAATGNLGTGGGGSPDKVGVEISFGGNTDGAFATAFMQLVRNGKIQILKKAIV